MKKYIDKKKLTGAHFVKPASFCNQTTDVPYMHFTFHSDLRMKKRLDLVLCRQYYDILWDKILVSMTIFMFHAHHYHLFPFEM